MTFDESTLDATAERLRRHLELAPVHVMAAGLTMVAYELLKSTVVGRVRGFFCITMNAEGEWVPEPDYANRVLPRAKHELDACLDWLVELEALTADQAASVGRVRDARNDVGHDLVRYLVDPDAAFDWQAVADAQIVLKRLAVFFGGIEADLLDDPREVDYEGIESGVSLLYGHLVSQVTALRMAMEDEVQRTGGDWMPS